MTVFRLDRRLAPDLLMNTLRSDAREGLTASPKHLPSKWFYDARGSELYELITRQPEYYPYRTERAILQAVSDEIALATQARSVIELGSGSAEKTTLLLGALRRSGMTQVYTSIDISESALISAGTRLVAEHSGLEVRALVADFEAQAEILMSDKSPSPRLILFLGGTIGQLMPSQRAAFFKQLRKSFRQGDMLLLGTDLVKDPAELTAAYDDAAGVSAAFNKNLLVMLNSQLGADFHPDLFDHIVAWQDETESMAMWLRSRANQVIRLTEIGLSVKFAAGERIRTGTSAKFRRDGIRSELENAGFFLCRWWTDPRERYALSLSRLT
jgi:L-histidine N-alpha-methyltransferase